MKVVLDLTALLNEKKITKTEYDKLITLSSAQSMNVLVNLFAGFGVFGVVGGIIALNPDPFLGVVLSIVMFGIGLFVEKTQKERWGLAATILMLIGALGTAAGTYMGLQETEVANNVIFTLITLILLAGALIAKSSLLTMCATLSISPLLEAYTFYGHASYFIVIQQPILTIAVFSIIGIGTLYVSMNSKNQHYAGMSKMAARASLFMVNLGFWVGSLWGNSGNVNVDDSVLAIAWAVALIGACVWGVKTNRRFVVNTCAVFGSIHFYTQWFEHLGARPFALIGGGIIAIIIALNLWKYNQGK